MASSSNPVQPITIPIHLDEETLATLNGMRSEQGFPPFTRAEVALGDSEDNATHEEAQEEEDNTSLKTRGRSGVSTRSHSRERNSPLEHGVDDHEGILRDTRRVACRARRLAVSQATMTRRNSEVTEAAVAAAMKGAAEAMAEATARAASASGLAGTLRRRTALRFAPRTKTPASTGHALQAGSVSTLDTTNTAGSRLRKATTTTTGGGSGGPPDDDEPSSPSSVGGLARDAGIAGGRRGGGRGGNPTLSVSTLSGRTRLTAFAAAGYVDAGAPRPAAPALSKISGTERKVLVCTVPGLC